MKLNNLAPACGLLDGICLRNLRKTNSLIQRDGSLSNLDYKVQCTSVAPVIQDCIIIIIIIIIIDGGGSSSSSSSSSSVSGGSSGSSNSMVEVVVVVVAVVVVVVVVAVA